MMKTQELTGPALDWAVAKCETLAGVNRGFLVIDGTPYVKGRNGCNGGLSGAGYSRWWQEGGPIIEREKITLNHGTGIGEGFRWVAATNKGTAHALGPTPLIAAMRCYVASKMGDEVNVPDELV